jgi:hypothetical protein
MYPTCSNSFFTKVYSKHNIKNFYVTPEMTNNYIHEASGVWSPIIFNYNTVITAQWLKTLNSHVASNIPVCMFRCNFTFAPKGIIIFVLITDEQGAETQSSNCAWNKLLCKQFQNIIHKTKVPCTYVRVTLFWGYLIVLWLFHLVCILYCDYCILFCNMSVFWQVCGCFGNTNMCTCIYYDLLLFVLCFILFLLCTFILICFVCTSVRTTATE